MEYWNSGILEQWGEQDNCSLFLLVTLDRTLFSLTLLRSVLHGASIFHHSSIPTFPQSSGVSPESWILTPDPLPLTSMLHALCSMLPRNGDSRRLSVVLPEVVAEKY